jgi:hypothetical protein
LNTIITNLQNRLQPVALEGGEEFNSGDTYQSKAVQRMAEIFGIDTVSDAKLIQFYVMFCILEATNGVSNVVVDSDPRFNGMSPLPGWISTSGWIGSTNMTVSGSDPCNGWYGITCDSQGRVTEIVLAKNLLTGHFPPEVVWLAGDGWYSTGAGYLNRIDLFKNPFLTNQDGDSYLWWANMGSNFGKITMANVKTRH